MPKGPQGQKRPTVQDDGKEPAAKALGANGGKKRAENMTPERARRDCEESRCEAVG